MNLPRDRKNNSFHSMVLLLMATLLMSILPDSNIYSVQSHISKQIFKIRFLGFHSTSTLGFTASFQHISDFFSLNIAEKDILMTLLSLHS